MTNEITISEGDWTTVQIEKNGDESKLSMLPDNYVENLTARGYICGKAFRKSGRTVTFWKKPGNK